MDEVLVLRASRVRWAALFLASAVFAAAGVLVFFVAPGGRGGGAAVFAFFGLGALVAAVQLLTGSSLVLTPEGFTVNSLGRRVTRRWQEIEAFVVVSPSAFIRIVGIRLAIPDEHVPSIRSSRRGLAGFESALPETYGMKATELAELMNEWLARHGECAGGGGSRGAE